MTPSEITRWANSATRAKEPARPDDVRPPGPLHSENDRWQSIGDLAKRLVEQAKK